MLGERWHRVHVERRGQPPALLRPQKPVVSEVIIAMGRQHVEGDASEELLEISIDVPTGSVVSDCQGHIQVARLIVILLARQRHRRCIEAALGTRTIEPASSERAVFASETEESRLGHFDPGAAREFVEKILARSDVVAIAARRELGEPQRPILT